MNKESFKWLLLSDVEGSRKISDRKVFEKKIAKTLQQVQQQYAGVFEMPMQIWKGLDETAAILKKPWCVYDVMDVIDEGIMPYKMRFVMVKGRLDVLPRNGDVSKADGEAFHTAAAQMITLKKSGLKFSCHTGTDSFDTACQTQLNLLWLVKKDWTNKQRLIYRSYRETDLQNKVAKALKVSQQNVSKTLKSISAAQVQQLETSIKDWMESELKP